MVEDMEKVGEYTSVFAIGAAGYTLLEILWRGYSHWTMALTGGICFLCIYLTQMAYGREPLWKKCLVGSLTITLAELLVGFVVNILLQWNVWDYSDRMLNLSGQICVLYSALWFLLCIPGLYLSGWIHRLVKQYTALRSAGGQPSRAASAEAHEDA